MFSERVGRPVLVRSMIFSLILMILGFSYYWLTALIRETYSAGTFKPFFDVLDMVLIFSIAVMTLPSKWLGLSVSENMFMSAPTTITGWVIGFIFLFILVYIISFFLSVLIEIIKTIFFKSKTRS